MDAALAITTAANPIAPAQGKGVGGITGDDFMKILIKQLQMQDPLEPMNNQEMIAQMSTIRELEMNTRLSQKLEQLTDQQRFGSAASLIGKHVKGMVTDAEGNEYEKEGMVISVRFTSKGEAMLELASGEVLPLANLEEVKNADGSDVEIEPEVLQAKVNI